MLIFGENWPGHRPWFIATAVATVGVCAWYGITAVGSGRWPGGSSLPGFVFGVAGGLIILFEMLLWPRKKFRAWRIGRATLWMKAHIWLGLLSLPLLVLHSGFRWGGTLSTVLMALCLIVIASGVWGLALQQFLPRRMWKDVPAETIFSQIDYILAQFRDDAERLVRATCGHADSPQMMSEGESSEESAHLVVGAIRFVGKVQGKVLQTRPPAPPVSGTQPLLRFFNETVAPFLAAKSVAGSPLRSARRSNLMFRDLRTRLNPQAHETLNTLEELCHQRRQFDKQARLHAWLHAWLCIHLPLSVGLFFLMFVHIFVALKFF